MGRSPKTPDSRHPALDSGTSLPYLSVSAPTSPVPPATSPAPSKAVSIDPSPFASPCPAPQPAKNPFLGYMGYSPPTPSKGTNKYSTGVTRPPEIKLSDLLWLYTSGLNAQRALYARSLRVASSSDDVITDYEDTRSTLSPNRMVHSLKRPEGRQEGRPEWPDHPLTASLLHGKGEYHRSRWEDEPAVLLLEQALAMRQRLFKGTAHNTVSVGVGLIHTTDSAVSESIITSTPFDTQSGSHVAISESLNALGELFRGRGMFFKADVFYSRALSIRLQTYGEDHPLVAEVQNNQGLLKYAQGDTLAAHKLLETSLTCREKYLGETHAAVGQTLNSLAG